MEKKNLIGLYVCAGLLAIAISLPLAVRTFTEASRCVTVKGLCEKEVEADRVIWPISYKEGGNSVAAISGIVAKKNAVILDWLKQAGFSEDEIIVSAPKIEDLAANSYSEHRSYDYVLTSVITICSNRVKEVIALQNKQFELLGKGIAIGSGNNWETPVTYDYTSLNSIKAGMVEQSIQNAREAALKFAQESGSRLGKIVNATQGQFTIADRDANTPYIKTIRVVSTVKYSLK